MTPLEEAHLAPARAFTGIVRGWHTDQKGRLAALRRSAGEPIVQARGVTWMYALLNSFGPTYGDEAVFLTATLLAFDRPFLEGRPHSPLAGSFGKTMAALKKDQPPSKVESIERRFAILLDADFDPSTGEGELPFRLRQTVKLILSKDVGVDWPQLLYDLRRWNDGDKSIQKRWAKEFYAQHSPIPTKEAQGEPDAD